MDVILKAEDIHAGYGKIHVLFGVDIKVVKNSITVIVGPNGSGKSTLLKTLHGITTLYKGRIFFERKEITRLKPFQRARLGIAYMPQLNNVFNNMSVRENLLMAAYLLDKDAAKERLEEVLQIFPFLRDYMNKKAYQMSGGERQMLALAICMMRRPKMILIDEPTSNLAPKIATQVFDKIIQLRDEYNTTILLVEQNAKKALEISDYAYLLVNGKTIYEGSADSLLNHPELGRMYLGLAR